jgi:hypothetical protein
VFYAVVEAEKSYDAASTDMAAKALDVSASSVERAKQVLKSGDEDPIDADMTSTVVVQRAYRTSTDMGCCPTF